MTSGNARVTPVSESKSDLVSIEMTESNQPSFSMSAWGRRTNLEKLLIFSVAALMAAIAVLVALAVLHFETSSSSVLPIPSTDTCFTSDCIHASSELLKNMDPAVDPCQDFYQYACGGFEKRMRIPDDRSSRSQFALIDDELNLQLRDILENNSTEKESRVFVQARDQYKACMNTDELERLGLQPLQDILRTFGGWPVLNSSWSEDSFDWRETTYEFRRNGYSTSYLFDFSIGTDIKNSTSRVIYFDQPSLGLSREYLIKGFDSEDVRHYYNYMTKTAELLGADPDEAAKQLKESLLFEIKLAETSLPREKRRNASKLYHPMELSALDSLAPIVNFTEYVNNVLTTDVIQVNGSERVVVSTPEYFKNLTELLEKEPKRNVANFLLWRAVKSSFGFLNKAAREVSLEYAKNITGRKAEPPRWKKCVSSAAGSFSAAVGNLYVSQFFKEDAKRSMLEMVRYIKDEFKNILKKVSWMDDKTRVRALNKLRAIKDYIGYPPEIKDTSKLEELYSGIQINSSTYFQNGISMSIWGTNYVWRKLREPVDKTDWKRHANPAVVNAYYNSIENSIQFPAGILQGTFFSKNKPQYMNYGGIGWVIGHEITHGFDDQGRQYDENGNLKDWWERETKERFLEKTQCIIWQYGNYTAKSVNLTLNGINTQGENIADNGGLKEAYNAYVQWEYRNGKEQTLPGLNLSQRQLFWLSAANTWCSKYRPKKLEKRIRTGVHSPGQFRVKGPFSNSLEFSRDFNCPLGSGMNTIQKCEVW